MNKALVCTKQAGLLSLVATRASTNHSYSLALYFFSIDLETTSKRRRTGRSQAQQTQQPLVSTSSERETKVLLFLSCTLIWPGYEVFNLWIQLLQSQFGAVYETALNFEKQTLQPPSPPPRKGKKSSFISILYTNMTLVMKFSTYLMDSLASAVWIIAIFV